MEQRKKDQGAPKTTISSVDDLENRILEEIDKEIFFSSAVASKKTQGVIKKRVEVLMLSIYEKINSAINKGEYMVENIELNKLQRAFLENKGFRISLTSGGANDTYRCKIFWN